MRTVPGAFQVVMCCVIEMLARLHELHFSSRVCPAYMYELHDSAACHIRHQT
jgi:hypothetical protein